MLLVLNITIVIYSTLLLLYAARNAEYLAKARRLNSNKGIAISKGIAQWRFTPLQAAAVVALKQVLAALSLLSCYCTHALYHSLVPVLQLHLHSPCVNDSCTLAAELQRAVCPCSCCSSAYMLTSNHTSVRCMQWTQQ